MYQQLEGAKRNKHVYEKLATELQKTGSDKSSVLIHLSKNTEHNFRVGGSVRRASEHR